MKFLIVAFTFYSIVIFGSCAFCQDSSIFRLKNHPTYFKEKSWKRKILILEEILISGIDEKEMIFFDLEVKKIVNYSIDKGLENLYVRSKLLSTYLTIDSGHYKSAHNVLIELEPFLKQDSDNKRLGFLYRNLGICEINLNLNSRALSSFKSSISHFKECNLSEEYMHSEALTASVLLRFKKYQKAERLLKKSISFMLKLKKYKTIYRYYHILATIYSSQNQKLKEKWANQKSYEFARKSKNLTIMSLAQNNLAIVKYYNGDLIESIRLFHRALETRLNIGQHKLVCESYYNIASVYEEIDLSKAIDYYEKSMKLAAKEKLYSDEGDAILALSEIHKMQGEFKKANKYLSNFIDLEEKMEELNSQDQLNNSEKMNSYELESKKMSLIKELKRMNQIHYRNQGLIGTLLLGYIVLLILLIRQRRKRLNSVV